MPVPFEDVVVALRKAIVAPSSINIRNAAVIAVAFFGVSRGAEVVALELRDVDASP